jgi:dCTP deaminase
MILPDFEIEHLCREFNLIAPFDPELLNPASYDLRLGTGLMIESPDHPHMQVFSLEFYTKENPYMLAPGEFVLADAEPIFNMPEDIAGQFVLKSSRAREGLQHLLAGFCDPLWSGSKLTLELKNVRRFHSLPIYPGLKIGQMVFHLLSANPTRKYSEIGHYNNHKTVHASWEAA